MTIISLTAENVMRLKAARLNPEPSGLVQICGRNGSGKTSLMQCIEWAFDGNRVIPIDPIREGTERALIKIETGDLIVEKTIRRATKPGGKPYTVSLAVYNAEGAKYPRPQEVLDAFVDGLAFDPEQFVSLPPDKQFDMLRSFVPGFDFDRHERDQAADAESRRGLNREIKALQAEIGPDVDYSDLPAVPPDESALIDQLSQVASHNGGIETERTRRTRLRMDLDASQDTVRRMRERVRELREQALKLEQEADGKDEDNALAADELGSLPPLPDPQDAETVRASIAEARVINARIQKRDARAALSRALASKQWEADSLADAIKDREAAKRAAIAAAKMPVDGLGFGDRAVLLHGHPFEQASSAERIRVALAIAFAKNPRLKVARIKNGSLLDEQTLADIDRMAVERGFQVWIERVETSGVVGFVVEDGEVHQAAVAEVA